MNRDEIIWVNGHPTELVTPDSHHRTAEELGIDTSGYVMYNFPPDCFYLSEESREVVGQLLGNWMAYTEDIYDELIDLGVEPIDLTYMINWKRD